MRSYWIHGILVLALSCLGAELVAQDGATKSDQAVIDAQLKDYPLDTCVVAGGKLGSMGDPINYVHEGRLVRFCCKGCIGAFKKDPAKYLKKVDEAASSKVEKKSASGFIQHPDDSYLDYQYEE